MFGLMEEYRCIIQIVLEHGNTLEGFDINVAEKWRLLLVTKEMLFSVGTHMLPFLIQGLVEIILFG